MLDLQPVAGPGGTSGESRYQLARRVIDEAIGGKATIGFISAFLQHSKFARCLDVHHATKYKHNHIQTVAMNGELFKHYVSDKGIGVS